MHTAFTKKTALCLDDEVLVALSHADTIADLGFARVHVAHTLTKALELINRQPVDFALLDMNLGQGETTFAIARTIRTAGGIVIFASGYGRSELPADLADVGLVDKPTSPGRLSAMIVRLFAHHGADTPQPAG